MQKISISVLQTTPHPGKCKEQLIQQEKVNNTGQLNLEPKKVHAQMEKGNRRDIVVRSRKNKKSPTKMDIQATSTIDMVR